MTSSIDNQHFEVVIIGAGMSGLAAGIRLALANKKVIILERHNASGGLNSFYSQSGRKFDVGLHAMTNYVPEGTKGTPLTKLMRQLRISRDQLDLCPQKGSRIHFPGCQLTFNNEFTFFESEVANAFPSQIDAFRALAQEIRTFDAYNLDTISTSARKVVRQHIRDPLLEDMIFCPIMYYGSAQENDIDYGQFVIMFRALFFEGFARPLNGVRVIIKLLQDKYRSLGGLRKMRCGVSKIHTKDRKATAIDLEDGSTITAKKILSTVGAVETARLYDDKSYDAASENIGQLSFTETITVLDRQPSDFGWNDTIIFFNTRERFHYSRVDDDLVDPTSGVICIPNNYQYGFNRQLDEGLLRVTAMANHDKWCALSERDYLAQKSYWYKKLQNVCLNILPDTRINFSSHCIASDMFTPRTIRKYTGHLNGAIYGTPRKIKDGLTHLDNLFIAGTDQGFLGIVGAMLSGISMANLHLLR